MKQIFTLPTGKTHSIEFNMSSTLGGEAQASPKLIYVALTSTNGERYVLSVDTTAATPKLVVPPLPEGAYGISVKARTAEGVIKYRESEFLAITSDTEKVSITGSSVFTMTSTASNVTELGSDEPASHSDDAEDTTE